jgi:hypothetical protein
MEYFYIIVLTVAIICLILTLTVIGIILSSQTNAAVFPPTQNSCPDYWTSGDNGGDTTKNICIPRNINIGTYGVIRDMSGVPGYIYPSNKIDFGDAGWGGEYSKTNQCALKLWSNQHNISWDGISNFNGC